MKKWPFFKGSGVHVIIFDKPKIITDINDISINPIITSVANPGFPVISNMMDLSFVKKKVKA